MGILFPVCLGFDLHGGVSVSEGTENTTLPQTARRGQEGLRVGVSRTGGGADFLNSIIWILVS